VVTFTDFLTWKSSFILQGDGLMACRSRDSILILLLIVVAVELPGCAEQTPVDSRTIEASANTDVRSEPVSHHNAGNFRVEYSLNSAQSSGTNPEVPATAAGTGDLTDEDLARSSWEDPFLPQLWSCKGWRFGAKSMACQSEQRHPATFLRPYRNIVIECQLNSPINSTITPSQESKQLSGQFELRLVNQSIGNWAGLTVDADSVSLTEFVAARQPVSRILRKCTHNFDNTSNQQVNVRMTMTANRILVAIDGRLKINVTRPGAVLNADCLAQFIAHQPGTSLSELRIEGE